MLRGCASMSGAAMALSERDKREAASGTRQGSSRGGGGISSEGSWQQMPSSLIAQMVDISADEVADLLQLDSGAAGTHLSAAAADSAAIAAAKRVVELLGLIELSIRSDADVGSSAGGSAGAGRSTGGGADPSSVSVLVAALESEMERAEGVLWKAASLVTGT